MRYPWMTGTDEGQCRPNHHMASGHLFANEEMMTESLVARVMAWMAEKRTLVNNDPRIVPGILGVAERTDPTW